MSPTFATIICIIFIFYFFRVERNSGKDYSNALWIPQMWILFGSSRYLSQWLNLSSPAVDIEDGSPVDRAVFFLLIATAVVALNRRGLNWGKVIGSNRWVWLYFAFGAVSLFWSDFPFVAVKRLIKSTGNVFMTIIILSEYRPYDAAVAIFRRMAFLFLPLSILFIKYYPDLGRTYTQSGQPTYTGVSTQKNSLGVICLVSAIYLGWSLIYRRDEHSAAGKKLSIPLTTLLVCMIIYLMNKADSATSLLCLVIALMMLGASRLRVFMGNPRRILFVGVVSICLIGVLQFSVGISETVISLLGRRPDLTERKPMWDGTLAMAGSSLVGVGFESFYLGRRLDLLYSLFSVRNAHNGYLEVYLNLGLIGLALIVGGMLSGLIKVSRHLTTDYPAAILRLCLIVVAIVYNWTESTFAGISPMWVLLFLGVIEVSEKQRLHNSTVTEGNQGSCVAITA